MSNLQNQVIKPFLEDIWDGPKCIHSLHEEDCSCYFNYHINYLEKALKEEYEVFDDFLVEGFLERPNAKKRLLILLLQDLTRDKKKAEKLLLMYKNFKKEPCQNTSN